MSVTPRERSAIALVLREQLYDLTARVDGWCRGERQPFDVLADMTTARGELNAITDTLVDLTVELRANVRDESRRAIADVEQGTSRLGADAAPGTSGGPLNILQVPG
jgi:hypothetical protein